MARTLSGMRGRFLLRPLNVIFGAPSHIALLRALFASSGGLTGREAARASGVAPRAAIDGLGRLEEAGVVRRRPVGRAYLFELRRHHRLVRAGLLPLLEQESRIRSDIFARLRSAFEKDTVSACAFGSAARGEETPESDLDVLALVDGKEEMERAEERGAAVADSLRRDYDVRASVIIMVRAEFVRGYRAGRSFMRNVVRDGEVFAGRPLRALVDG